jgi:hypothetical protein
VTLKPLPADGPDWTDTFENGFRQMNEGIKNVLDGFNGIVRYVYDHRYQFAPILLVLKKQLAAMKKGVDLLVNLVKYVAEHHLPVVSLIVQSFRWITAVQTPVSDLSAKVAEPRNPDLAYWTGTGANVYHQKAGMQRSAIDAVTGKAAFISEWLMKIASANVKYIVSLAQTVVDVGAKFLVVTVEGASVVGIAFAMDRLAEGVEKLIAEGVKALVGLGDEFMAVVANVRDIVSEVGDHTVLSGGKWPQAVYEPAEHVGPVRGTAGLDPW